MAALAFAACDDNEKPEFDDADAFVSFASSTATLAETTAAGEAGETSVTLTLASVAGISSTVEVQVIDSSVDSTYKATEGEDFEIEGSKTLSFDAENRTVSVTIKSIPNGEYTGDMKFALSIVDGGKVGVGVENTCVVTINDSEHPLQAILGNYTGKQHSYWETSGYGPYDLTVTISKDDDDDSKVWISGFDGFWVSYGYYGSIYGVVNEERTEIAVPAEQDFEYSSTSGGQSKVGAYSTADPDDANAKSLEAGDNMTFTIEDGGAKIIIENSYGVYDDNGWWSLSYGGTELTKQ